MVNVRAGLVVFAAWVVLLPLTACSSTSSASALHLSVSPSESAGDLPIHISVSSLKPGQVVDLNLSTTVSNSGQSVQWTSRASFRADQAGNVNLDNANPLGGDYTGAHGTGLFWSLHPSHAAFASGHDEFIWPHGRLLLQLSATAAGGFRQRLAFSRSLVLHDVTQRRLDVASTGLSGTYYSAPRFLGRRPAVLIFGGSEGGETLQLSSQLLADHGFRVFNLAYFRAPGLPNTLTEIPLEYFGLALDWLRRQPDVDPNRLMVRGYSRGTEAALLLGLHYPKLVSAIVLGSPTNTVHGSFPRSPVGAWTFGGHDVAYTKQWDNPAPSDEPGAVIPVERINVPLFMVCGGKDVDWVSCDFVNAMQKRLAGSRSYSRDVFLRFARADHYVGTMSPYRPYAQEGWSELQSDQEAWEQVWPRQLRFLDEL